MLVSDKASKFVILSSVDLAQDDKLDTEYNKYFGF